MSTPKYPRTQAKVKKVFIDLKKFFNTNEDGYCFDAMTGTFFKIKAKIKKPIP